MNYSRSEAIETMNRYGAEHRPFLFIIDYEMDNNHVIPLDEVDPEHILFDFNGQTNCALPELIPSEVEWERFPIPYEEYKRRLDIVIAHLKRGNSFLTNLTVPTPVRCNFSLRDIFLSCSARYRLWMKDAFCALSPEIFVRINEGLISSYPMKGTIDASVPGAEAKILNDIKESAEHATIVDLIRNDLSIFAKDVNVSRYRYIDRLQTNDRTLLQVSSEVSGVLPPDYCARLGTIFYSMLPAGSICGAPKPKTLEIIREAEEEPRGYYTGIAGIFDGGNLDSGVLIRFTEQKPDGSFIFHSGGGITAKSDPESEYEEMIQKVYLPLNRKQ